MQASDLRGAPAGAARRGRAKGSLGVSWSICTHCGDRELGSRRPPLFAKRLSERTPPRAARELDELDPAARAPPRHGMPSTTTCSTPSSVRRRHPTKHKAPHYEKMFAGRFRVN